MICKEKMQLRVIISISVTIKLIIRITIKAMKNFKKAKNLLYLLIVLNNRRKNNNKKINLNLRKETKKVSRKLISQRRFAIFVTT